MRLLEEKASLRSRESQLLQASGNRLSENNPRMEPIRDGVSLSAIPRTRPGFTIALCGNNRTRRIA